MGKSTEWSNKQQAPTFVDISAMRADFLHEIFAQLLNNKKHTLL